MKRLFVALVVTVVLLPTLALGAPPDAQHRSIGLGFRAGFLSDTDFPELRTTAPIGLRWWFESQKVGIDVAFGFLSREDPPSGERLTDWSFEAGVPFVVHGWDRVHVVLRPGFNYTSRSVLIGVPLRTDSDTYVTVSGEVEAEVFLAENLSLSASHGIGFVSYNPAAPGAESTLSYATFGNNATTLGFHVYLWGTR